MSLYFYGIWVEVFQSNTVETVFCMELKLQWIIGNQWPILCLLWVIFIDKNR